MLPGLAGESHQVFVGIGSNLLDPAGQVLAAMESLDALPATRLIRRSRLYRSPPWGVQEQPPFVNAVVELQSALDATELLGGLFAIEQRTGRQRTQRWGPRVIDLDLLIHGRSVLSQPGLQLPHPHLHERAFVLLPLAEIAPNLVVPGLGPVVDLLRTVDCAGVEALG